MVVSATLIAAVTLGPGAGGAELSPWCLVCGDYATIDAVLNVLLFVPLGCALAAAGVRGRWAIPAMVAASSLIETLQLVLAGRNASAADVITNSLGGAIGVMLYRHHTMLVRPRPRTARRLQVVWSVVWLGLLALIAYALLPIPSETPYYSHIKRPHWQSHAIFPGDVVSASVAGEPVSLGMLANGPRLKTLIQEGAALDVVATTSAFSPARSEIVVVSGSGGVVGLEHEGADIIFTVRNGADALRLRPLEFLLRDVLRAPPPGSVDTTTVSGRYGRTEVVVRATTPMGPRELRSVPRLSEGWVLFAPFQPQIDGGAGELFASGAFMALLLLPVGYWTRLASEPLDRSNTLGRALVLVCVVAVGLVGIPMAFGLRRSSPWEWGACALGYAVGVMIERSLSRATPRLSLPGVSS